MAFLNKHKINIFLGISALIFISIFSISNSNLTRKVNPLERLSCLKLKEINYNYHIDIADRIMVLNKAFLSKTPILKKAKQYNIIQLIYYIQEGQMEIILNNKELSFNAASGGGAYANTQNADKFKEDLRNNICHLDKVTKFNSNNEVVERGGPIVPGVYTFETDIEGALTAKQDGRMSDNRFIRLNPNHLTERNIQLLGRKGGFRIHCRGGRGSDGCIVPQNCEHFQKLLDLVSISGHGILLVKKSKYGMEYTCGNKIIDALE